MPVVIPNTFIKIALENGIPTKFAPELYLVKAGKKNCDGIAYKLVLGGICSTESEARLKIAKTWKTWKINNANMQMTAQSSYVTSRKAVKLDKTTYLDEAREGLSNLIGPLNDTSYSNKSNLQVGRRIWAGDTHFPFADKKAIEKFLNDPAEEAVIMGDTVDMYAASKYRSTIDYISTREELALGRAFAEETAKRFKRVYVLKESNHDIRPIRRMQEMFPQLLPLMINPTELIWSGFPNVKIISTVLGGTKPEVAFGEDIEMGFMGVLDDCVFGHFEQFYGPDAAKKVEGWLGEWSHVVGVTPRVILQAHSHRLSSEITPKGRLLINTGCMCRPMEYQIMDHGRYSPPTPGFVITYHENGKTLISKTELVPAHE